MDRQKFRILASKNKCAVTDFESEYVVKGRLSKQSFQVVTKARFIGKREGLAKVTLALNRKGYTCISNLSFTQLNVSKD